MTINKNKLQPYCIGTAIAIPDFCEYHCGKAKKSFDGWDVFLVYLALFGFRNKIGETG